MKRQQTNKGRFITIEGGEGVGKSTLVTSLKEWIESQGHSVVLTREPGGTPFGEALRGIILHQKLDPRIELLLFFSARLNHIQNLIRPALEQGSWVICDRYTDSTVVYQGVLRGLGLDYVENLWHMISQKDNLIPDITLLLDCPVDIAFKRIRRRHDQNNKFEDEKKEFHEALRIAYLDQAKAHPERIRILEANGTRLELFKKARGVFEYLIS